MSSKEQRLGPSATSHFDRRSATYDQGEIHHNVVALLIAGAEIRTGFRVLDIATGTGLLAIEAAQKVGPAGKVLGIDVSKGMLAEARRKAAAAQLRNIDFVLSDAERLEFPPDSFDCVFCSSALVSMSDIPRALRHWIDFLKPGGTIAFDAPSKPFGIAQVIADIAAEHGVHLTYSDIADTPNKCCSLLKEAGFEVVAVRTELANTNPIELSEAIAFWDTRLDHPAWRALKEAQSTTREAMRSEYVERVTVAAVAGYVPNDTALNFVFGRKPATHTWGL
jgi:ubiquinone/menaquinone biosynthesis C-methylase UbiE